MSSVLLPAPVMLGLALPTGSLTMMNEALKVSPHLQEKPAPSCQHQFTALLPGHAAWAGHLQKHPQRSR